MVRRRRRRGVIWRVDEVDEWEMKWHYKVGWSGWEWRVLVEWDSENRRTSRKMLMIPSLSIADDTLLALLFELGSAVLVIQALTKWAFVTWCTTFSKVKQFTQDDWYLLLLFIWSYESELLFNLHGACKVLKGEQQIMEEEEYAWNHKFHNRVLQYFHYALVVPGLGQIAALSLISYM